MAGALIFILPMNSFVYFYLSLHRQKTLLKIYLFTLIVYILLCVIIIPQYGFIGASWSADYLRHQLSRPICVPEENQRMRSLPISHAYTEPFTRVGLLDDAQLPRCPNDYRSCLERLPNSPGKAYRETAGRVFRYSMPE